VLDKLGRASEAREVWIPALELRPELSLGYFRRTWRRGDTAGFQFPAASRCVKSACCAILNTV